MRDVEFPWWGHVATAVFSAIVAFCLYENQRSLITLEAITHLYVKLEQYGMAGPSAFDHFNNRRADAWDLRQLGDIPKESISYTSEVQPGRVVPTYVLTVSDLRFDDCVALGTPLVFKKIEVNGRNIGQSVASPLDACHSNWSFKRSEVVLRP